MIGDDWRLVLILKDAGQHLNMIAKSHVHLADFLCNKQLNNESAGHLQASNSSGS